MQQQSQSQPQHQPSKKSLAPQNLENQDSNEKDNCPMCRIDLIDGVDGISCDMCKCWYHRECLFMSADEYNTLSLQSISWYCVNCLSIRSNKIKWGNLDGETAIRTAVSSIYNEVITWRKNLFMVPRGKAGTDFIKEISRIIRLLTIPSKPCSG